MQRKYTLGLDIGVASIGWAVVDFENQFIDSGVRVFPAGIDKFNTPKESHGNQDRRIHRGARRLNRRKAQRKALLKTCLKELGWMPEDQKDYDSWTALNVYELRSRAIQEQIDLSELGRILLHFSKLRGFLSLRKSAENLDKKSKGMLGAISELQKQIEDSGKKTLGAYLYGLYEKDAEQVRIRGRHIRRQMIYDEFDAIWNTQKAYYPKILTDQLRWGTLGQREQNWTTSKPVKRSADQSILEQFGIENILFFQRAVYWNKETVGLCEFEQSEYRAPKSDRRFQEFRLLSEVNNLSIIDSSTSGAPKERELLKEERTAILEKLYHSKSQTFEQLKKTICKINQSLLIDHIQFNLEGGGRTEISGMATDKVIGIKVKKKDETKDFKKEWDAYTEVLKNQVVEILTHPEFTDEAVESHLRALKPALSQGMIDHLLTVHLPAGYGHLSIKALERLLPHIREGYRYSMKDSEESALHRAGYMRPDEVERTALDLLPLYDSKENPDFKTINNPVVIRTLNELRKVVNALIRQYGKPEKINIEMIRDLKLGPKKRRELIKQNRLREQNRARAKEQLEAGGVVANRASVDLYLLWEEQNGQCVYSGKAISFRQLLSGEMDIDHILPGKYLDNSFMNKVVSFRYENDQKGKRSPYQWLAESEPERYEELLQRIRLMKLPYPKQKKFFQKKAEEDYLARDLNDTAWIARTAREYLALVFDNKAGKRHEYKVLGVKGRFTAQMREHWKLNYLLRSDIKDLKNREDHRHHALDAIVIACLDNQRIQGLSAIHDLGLFFGETEEGKILIKYKMRSDERLALPWNQFSQTVQESLDKIWVSHKARTKISGRLHQETNYGLVTNPDGKPALVVRKEIGTLSSSELVRIRDEAVAQAIDRHIEEGFSLKDKENPPRMLSGQPIKKVRISIESADAIPLRPKRNPKEWVRPANTHHVAIYKNEKGQVFFEAVSLMEVMQRRRKKVPINQKMHQGVPLWMTLSAGETIMTESDEGKKLFVYKTISSVSKQISFADHRDASKGNKDQETGKSFLITAYPNTFAKNFPNARKVSILPSGAVRDVGV